MGQVLIEDDERVNNRRDGVYLRERPQMRKYLIFLLLFCNAFFSSSGQNAVLSSGQNATGPGGTASYSVGQVGFAMLSNSTNAGVQQVVGIKTVPDTAFIMLVNLAAVKQGNHVLLNWETSAEKNSDHFIIQRSADGITFTSGIGTVAAVGNSSVSSYYSFIDSAPISGMNFYRLKMVDKFGKFKYSGPVNVIFELKTGISFSPNPVTSFAYLKIEDPNLSGYVFQVSDVYGRRIKTGMISSPLTMIPMQFLKPGIYYIKVENGRSQPVTLVIIKQ